MTVSQRLADYVCGLSFEELPADVVDKVKAVITHDLAIAIAGSRAPESARAVAFLGVDGEAVGRSTVIGTGSRASTLGAAFANAVMMRALRQEDTILPAAIHAGPLLIPTALAVGEARAMSGRDVIAAVIAGYEVLGKLAGSQWPLDEAYRTSSHVYGAFGPAVVAAKLLALDRDQTATAIAYAGNLAAMITAGYQNHQYGLLVRNGITSAYLGHARAPAPADAIEGKPGFYHAQCDGVPDDLEEQLGRLGTTYEVMTSVLKPYPCTAINLVPVQLLLRVCANHGVTANEIATVHVTRSHRLRWRSRANDTGPWSAASHRISSLPFALAAIQLDGDVTSERLHQPADPAILERAGNVTIDFGASDDVFHHHIEVRTHDGRRFGDEGDARSLEAPDPVTTMRTLASDVIGEERADRLAELVAQLEQLDSLEELTGCLR